MKLLLVLIFFIGLLIGAVAAGALFGFVERHERITGTIEVSSNPDKDFYTLHIDDLDALETKEKVIFKITRT